MFSPISRDGPMAAIFLGGPMAAICATGEILAVDLQQAPLSIAHPSLVQGL